MDGKEISKMNNASLKQKQIDLDYEYNGYKKQIDDIMSKMQACHDDYLLIQKELNKRNFK